MSTVLPPSAAPSINRYENALRLNKASLKEDLSAASASLQDTIQLQQVAQKGLLDKIALHEAQLKESQQETARTKADLQAEKVASAAMARQITSQQKELAEGHEKNKLLQQENGELRKLLAAIVYNHNREAYILNLARSAGGLQHLPEVHEWNALRTNKIPESIKEGDEFLKKLSGPH